MYLAIDIGGTKIAFAKFNSLTDTEPAKLEEYSTPKDYETGFNSIVKRIEKYASWEKLDGIGIAFAGRIVNDRIDLGTNIRDWENQPLMGSLREKFHVPIAIDNDAVCAALAERALGKAQNTDNYLFMVMSTGMGGTFVKKMPHGYYSIPLEPEYMLVNPEGGQSRDGFRTVGLLGAYASGDALQDKLGMSSLSILEDEDPIWNELSKYLAVALNNLCMIFNPEIIYFSGGLIQNRPFILDIVNQKLQRYSEYLKIPPMELSGIPSNASLLGAKLLLDKNIT